MLNYFQFAENFRAELAPSGLLEETLATEIVTAAWRLNRLTDSDETPEAERSRNHAHRILHRCTAELRRLQTNRRLWRELAPEQTGTGLASYRDILTALALEARRQTLDARLHKPSTTETAQTNETAVKQDQPTAGPRKAHSEGAAAGHWLRSAQTAVGPTAVKYDQPDCR
jgi:hypothetical protein